jgi:glycosyltransferase involved in cell wall biosynthesis
MRWLIKEKLQSALREFAIDVIVAENCVSIPMNLPLGLVLVEAVMETGTGCIAHHHDFVWERERYLVTSVEDYLRAAFPPALPQMQHVVINSRAARDFSRNTGLSCRLIPNVMDFDNPPEPADVYALGFRRALGLAEDDLVILQPTRVVQRKGIEHSIELLRKLGNPRAKLVITHASGDEGDAYAARIVDYAELMGVRVVFAEQYIAPRRGMSPGGRPLFTVWDAYRSADLVTYPSTYEGFGNAFLEAVYFRKPIFSNRYAIYRTDIEPCGFRAILMDGFLTADVVEEVRRMLEDPAYRNDAVDWNYQIGRHYFSYDRLETELWAILAKPRLVSHGS